MIYINKSEENQNVIKLMEKLKEAMEFYSKERKYKGNITTLIEWNNIIEALEILNKEKNYDFTQLINWLQKLKEYDINKKSIWFNINILGLIGFIIMTVTLYISRDGRPLAMASGAGGLVLSGLVIYEIVNNRKTKLKRKALVGNIISASGNFLNEEAQFNINNQTDKKNSKCKLILQNPKSDFSTN